MTSASVGLRGFACAALVGITLPRGSVHAAPGVGPTISVDELRPGMEGYGLTVFEGTEPERFPVRLVAVLHNFLPKEDVILVKSDDPRLVHSGIAQGMSGSPVYFDGRLAGALSYGWGFAKDPIAGVTPIANMVRELDRPLRGNDASPLHASVIPAGPAGLQPSALPLTVSGLSSQAVAELGDALAPFHIVPQQGGGTRGPRRGKGGTARFEPGGTIAVELIRGDVSAVATGTVTAVAGDRVLAFGHPMFNAGEVALPIATGAVHAFMSSLNTSFKISSPVDEAGVLLQDRQAGIVGDMSRRVPMVPIVLTLKVPGRPPERFDVEVARHRFLTGTLATSVVASAATSAAADATDATITMKTHVDVRNQPSLDVTDQLYAPDGVTSRSLGSARGLHALNDILFNTFSPALVDRVAIDIDVAYRADVAEIVELSLGAETVEPGSRPSLRVTLRPYGKPDETMFVPFDVPMSLAGQTVKLTVQAGGAAHPDTAPPESLRELIGNLGRVYPAQSLVVGVELPDEGVTLHGRLVPELPGSVLDSLRPSTASRRSDSLHRVDRTVVPTSYVTVGKQELTLRVHERR